MRSRSAVRTAVVGAAVLLAAALTVVQPARADNGGGSSSGGITFAPSGPATPFPSAVTVGGLSGRVLDVRVKLTGFAHERPQDVELVLLSPAGTAVQLMSDACASTAITEWSLTFTDTDPALPNGPCPSHLSTFAQPTDLDDGSGDQLVGFPLMPWADDLADLDGEDPNGTWRLFAGDDAAPMAGSIAGWSLTISTADWWGPGATTNWAGAGSPYPVGKAVDVGPARVRGVSLVLADVTHTRASHLDVLVVGPDGTAVLVLSGACGTALLNKVDRTFTATAPAPLPATSSLACTSAPLALVRPSVYDAPAALPAPAPPGPYRTDLAAFAGTVPNGTWRTYIADGEESFTGHITTVDTVLDLEPDTILGRHPRKHTKKRKARFTWSAFRGFDATDHRVECRLDKGPWRVCPQDGITLKVKRGKHVLRVRSVDAYNQVTDPTPATWRWWRERKRR